MDRRWRALLEELASAGEALRDELRAWPFREDPARPFMQIKRPNSPFLEERLIDWKKLHAIEGSGCNYGLDTPHLGLLYYDKILLGISPCPREKFDRFHSFRFDDLERLAKRARSGKVGFYLTDRPRDFLRYAYLQPLLEEFRPVHLIAASARIVDCSKLPFQIDEASEGITDLPHVRASLERLSRRSHIALEVADATTCMTIQELEYAGYGQLAWKLVELLEKEPDSALIVIWELRRIFIDALVSIPGIPLAVPSADLASLKVRGLRRNHISSLPDVGAVVAKILSFPTPTDWDQLSWCEEHLDIPALRRAFRILDKDAQTLDVAATSESIQSHVRQAWEARRRSVSRVRNRVLWGSSLTLAVGGVFVGDPVAGILSGIGLTSAQNLWQDQLNSLTAKWLSPESFHIWDVERRSGRPR